MIVYNMEVYCPSLPSLLDGKDARRTMARISQELKNNLTDDAVALVYSVDEEKLELIASHDPRTDIDTAVP